jgi:hypothetical protein
MAPDDLEVIEIFHRVARFSVELGIEINNADAQKNLQWTNTLVTICHELLNTQKPVDDTGNEEREIIREATRLALLLFLAPIRRLLAVSTFSTTAQLEKLTVLMFIKDIRWAGLQELRLWVITMGILEATSNSDLKCWVSLWRTQETVADLSLALSKALIRNASGIMWIRDLHEKKLLEMQVDDIELLDYALE